VARVKLAAAISRAGGLGVIAAAHGTAADPREDRPVAEALLHRLGSRA
jgi:NAD(P)H-dependent flavin oxidoreductase YrpB (nitropropane dioxygenase family)